MAKSRAPNSTIRGKAKVAAPLKAPSQPIKLNVPQYLLEGFRNALNDVRARSFVGEAAASATWRVVCSILVAVTISIAVIEFPESLGSLAVALLNYLIGKRALFGLGVEVICGIIAISIAGFFGLNLDNFNPIQLARKAITSTLYWAFAAIGGIMLLGSVLDFQLGNKALGLHYLTLCGVAYLEVYLCIVPFSRWVLSRPSVFKT